MKIVLLTAGGRAGADFFHSLLDSHSQILQFPGYIKANNDLKFILRGSSFKNIAKLFIKSYPEFFDSKKNKLERWNKLGIKKNKSFKVSTIKFVKKFSEISIKKKDQSDLEKLKNLHIAYFLARNKKINDIKILFIHTHLYLWTKNFIKIFNLKNFHIIYTIRHPLSSLSSLFTSWFNYKKGKEFFSRDLFNHLDNVIFNIYKLNNLGKVNIIQLDKLHTQNLKVMKSFC